MAENATADLSAAGRELLRSVAQTLRSTAECVVAVLDGREVEEGAALPAAPAVAQEEREEAGECTACGLPVYLHPDRPGEYDHDCPPCACGHEADDHELDRTGRTHLACVLVCDCMQYEAAAPPAEEPPPPCPEWVGDFNEAGALRVRKLAPGESPSPPPPAPEPAAPASEEPDGNDDGSLDITTRLLAACTGRPATIPWPHRLLHAAVEEIAALRGQLAARKREGEPHSTAAHVVTKSREGGRRDEPPHYYAVLPRRETREEALADLARWEALDGQRDGEPSREVLLRMLRRVEWVGAVDGNAYCPDCENRQDAGHEIDCELAALLAGEPVAPPEGGVPAHNSPLWEDARQVFVRIRGAGFDPDKSIRAIATALRLSPARSAPAAPAPAAEGAEPVGWAYRQSEGLAFYDRDEEHLARHDAGDRPVFALYPPPPPADADRELRRAAEGVFNDTGIGEVYELPPEHLHSVSGSVLRRLREALDSRSTSVPAPPALDEEDTVELDAYILPVVASIRDAIRAEGQREEDDRDAELESALRGLVAALERKAGEARNA